MTGSDAEKLLEIDTSCGGWLVWQALLSAVSMSSITAKSAASARSITCTRTVAFAGLLVKLTWRADCQGSEVSCTEVSATAMQGRASASSSPRARKAVTARGTTEARIRKRNMEHSLAQSLMTFVIKLLFLVEHDLSENRCPLFRIMLSPRGYAGLMVGGV